MQITKELLVERLEVLRTDYARLMSDAAATNGAIQDTEFWLSVLEKQAEPEKAE